MRYETITTLNPSAALVAAEEFFIGEMGLTERKHDPHLIEFVGGDGSIAINILSERPTTLEIETRDWDVRTTMEPDRALRLPTRAFPH